MEEKNLKKIGTEKEFKHELGKITVGTVDKKNCISCYVKISTYAIPENSIAESIDMIRRRVKANMFNIGLTYLEDDFRTYNLQTECNTTKVKDKPGKKQYIAAEVTLFANHTFEYNKDFVFVLENIGKTLFDLISTVDCVILSSK